jgi:hypothetical protein
MLSFSIQLILNDGLIHDSFKISSQLATYQRRFSRYREARAHTVNSVCLARAGPATAPVFHSDCGFGHSLRAETAWLRAHGRLWRFVVQARPFARIAPGRRRSGRDTGGLAALPTAPTPSSTPGLSPSPAPAPARWPVPLDPGDDAQTPLGCRCSLSLHRSRIRSVRSLTPVGCLIVAPAPAGGRRRERLRPSAPQGIARCAALHLARRC